MTQFKMKRWVPTLFNNGNVPFSEAYPVFLKKSETSSSVTQPQPTPEPVPEPVLEPVPQPAPTPVFPLSAPAWRLTFENNSFLDMSGNNVVVNPSGNPIITNIGGRNNVCNFDRVDDYFIINKGLTASYTKVLWAWLEDTDPNGNFYHLISSNQGTTHAFSVREGSLKARNQPSTLIVSDNVTFPRATWVHIALTYSNTDRVMKLYKNGILSAQGTSASEWTGGNADTIQLGIYFPGDATNSFKGYIDNPAVWDYALSEQQVLDLYNFEK